MLIRLFSIRTMWFLEKKKQLKNVYFEDASSRVWFSFFFRSGTNRQLGIAQKGDVPFSKFTTGWSNICELALLVLFWNVCSCIVFVFWCVRAAVLTLCSHWTSSLLLTYKTIRVCVIKGFRNPFVFQNFQKYCTLNRLV